MNHRGARATTSGGGGDRRAKAPLFRPWPWASGGTLVIVLALMVWSWATPAQAQSGDVGYLGFSHGTSGVSAPTGEKPESKLWWNDGYWWGSLYNDAARSYHIYRLNLASQRWEDTGTAIDDRNSSKGDALWDGQRLYVVSHIFTTSAGSSSSSNWGRLYRYSYNAAQKRYSLDPGFPVTNVTRGRSETLTIAKDSTGQLWVSYVESGRVMVNRSLGSDLQWGTPFILPGSATATTVNSDDIAAVVAFQGNKIGVMWSNQNTDKVYFAAHLDSAPDEQWELEQTALPGPGCSGPCADDHISLTTLRNDPLGRVFAAIKTSHIVSQEPLMMLLVRDGSGRWDSHVFGRVADGHTRPIVLLDEEHNRLYMFATAPEPGGAIYYKSTDLNNIAFAPGLGQPFIKLAASPRTNNATSTKQNVNSATGIVVLASDSNRWYVHNFMSLGGGTPPPATPQATATASPTPSATPQATATASPTPSATPQQTTTAVPQQTATPTTRFLPLINFENGLLVDSATGVDRVVGGVVLETAAPLAGGYSATVPNLGNAYLEKNFTQAEGIYISFYLRVHALPNTDIRVMFVDSAGTTVGNFVLRANGQLRLRNGSTTIGTSPFALTPGVVYRLGLYQRAGAGANGILEGYLAEAGAPFGAPFATLTNGTWTTPATRTRLGATVSNALNATFDNIELDTAAMPGP